MKIGFDISQTGKLKAGCGYFADSLIRALAQNDSENEYVLYPTFGDLYWDPDWSTGTCQMEQPNFRPASGHKSFEASRFFWQHPPRDWMAKLGNPNVIHCNNFFCPTILKDIRLVYTLYDLSFLIHPKWTTEENRTGCFQGVFNASLYADYILSISEYSRRHFLEVFPHYPEDRIIVVYPSSRFSHGNPPLPMPQGLPTILQNPFWLTVGVLEPRKNHRGLLLAYALLKADLGGTYPLVLAGGKGWLMDEFEKDLDVLNLRQDVILLGYIENETLRWLYQNCFAFIYPSLFEGFGMPVLEAMSLAAPVIASRVSSIPEIVGDAGILIDPSQEGEISRAMGNLVRNPGLRQTLKEKAKHQAARFSWKSSARKVLDLYQDVIQRDPIFSDRLPKEKGDLR